jgi:hypothetical protein
MSYEEPTTETESLSADEQKVREMCISLKKINAPKDFDFKLKARIANHQPGDFQPRFGFAFRYALPALAMIFVLGFLAYNSGIFSSSNKNPVVAQSSPETKDQSAPQNTVVSTFSPPEKKEPTNENSAILPSIQQTSKPSEKQQVAENDLQKSKKVLVNGKKDSFTGSKVSALKEDKTIQQNINSNTTPQKPQNIVKVTPMPVKEILGQFGIDAVFEDGKWIVKSVVQNGVGESSGIKEKDIVEAIDNQTVSNQPISAKTLNVKNITVSRGGKKLEIKLRNKQ